MSSTFSTAGTHIDRKSLKRPDGFTAMVSSFMKGLSKQTGLFIAILGGLLAIGVGIALYINRLEAKSLSARNAFYQAEKAWETEFKALDARENPKQKESTKEAPSAATEALLFKKLDVDAQFPEAIKKLKAVDSEFATTRSAYEARLKLANLYYHHGNYEKALPWYQKALETAPNKLEKAIALTSLGYTLESLGKPTDALQFFQKAVNLGEGSLKGDLLLAVARNYEALQDTANARSTYEKIILELPNTEFSKAAETYKAQLP